MKPTWGGGASNGGRRDLDRPAHDLEIHPGVGQEHSQTPWRIPKAAFSSFPENRLILAPRLRWKAKRALGVNPEKGREVKPRSAPHPLPAHK